MVLGLRFFLSRSLSHHFFFFLRRWATWKRGTRWRAGGWAGVCFFGVGSAFFFCLCDSFLTFYSMYAWRWVEFVSFWFDCLYIPLLYFFFASSLLSCLVSGSFGLGLYIVRCDAWTRRVSLGRKVNSFIRSLGCVCVSYDSCLYSYQVQSHPFCHYILKRIGMGRACVR